MLRRVNPGPLRGSLRPPADKSISHRALLLSALAKGDSQISNLLLAGDILSSWGCLAALGVEIAQVGQEVIVRGSGGHFAPARQPISLGNSGTTMRLMTGILAGQPLQTVLTGDASLNNRPILRVLDPLRVMGAEAYATPRGTPPVLILGQPLRAIEYTLPIASAQLKSAILLAAISARGESVVVEPVPSRDHTERMLSYMGASLKRSCGAILVAGSQQLVARKHYIPGDFSSAAPLITAALLAPGSQLRVRDVGLNPTRTGLLTVLRRMGAVISAELRSSGDEEPFGELLVSSQAELVATEVTASEIPLLIDEVPLLVVAACLAQGTTTIHGIEELRIKESDRVESIVRPLNRMGASITVENNRMIIRGRPGGLAGGETVSAARDHRIAMALAVAATVSRQPVDIDGAEWVTISYPEFFHHLEQLQGSRGLSDA